MKNNIIIPVYIPPFCPISLIFLKRNKASHTQTRLDPTSLSPAPELAFFILMHVLHSDVFLYFYHIFMSS